jgi:hypothetical protein
MSPFSLSCMEASISIIPLRYGDVFFAVKAVLYIAVITKKVWRLQYRYYTNQVWSSLYSHC